LRKWGRFQVVSDSAQADVVFEFRYAMARAPETAHVNVYDPNTGNTTSGSATTPGVWMEFFTIMDAKTKDVLYEDGRAASPPTGAVPVIIGAFRRHSMALDMVNYLRSRIEATESARTLEYTIHLTEKTAKLHTDTSTLDEKLATLSHSPPPTADSLVVSLKEGAKSLKERADQLSKTNAEMEKFLAEATEAALLDKRNIEKTETYRNFVLTDICGKLEKQKEFARNMGALRTNLPKDDNRALDAVEDDLEALNPDCSSQLAVGLLKKNQ